MITPRELQQGKICLQEVEEAVRQREELSERLRRQERASPDPAVERQWQQRVASLEVSEYMHITIVCWKMLLS